MCYSSGVVSVSLNSSMFTFLKDKGLVVKNRQFPMAPKYEFPRKKLFWLGASGDPSSVSCFSLRGASFRSVCASVCGGSGRGPHPGHLIVHNPVGARRGHLVLCGRVRCRSSRSGTGHTPNHPFCVDVLSWQSCSQSHSFGLPSWVATPSQTGPFHPATLF